MAAGQLPATLLAQGVLQKAQGVNLPSELRDPNRIKTPRTVEQVSKSHP